MITLHYMYPACSTATHIALEESGLDYEPVETNVYDPAARAEFLKINPKGKLPTIVVDGKLLTENVAILTFIARSVPERHLIPDDPWEASQCLSLLAWFASTVHIAFRQSFRPDKLARDPAAHASIQEVGRADFWEALQWMDRRLASQLYMMGNAFTIADTYPLVFYNWGGIGGYPTAQLKNLTAFKSRMIERPAVQRILERERCPLIS